MVLNGRYLAATSLNPGTASRKDVIPVLENFGPEITKQALNFQQYRIRRVHVKWINMTPVNLTTQPLLYMYKVPLTTDTVPAPSEAAFLAFKNCKYHSFRRDENTSFVPFVRMGTQ